MASSVASQAPATVLLPGDILVSGSGQILLLEPGGREPQVVSSPSVGSGAPYYEIADFTLGPDGFLYAFDKAANVLRIDPATGNRVVVSSNTVGAGDLLRGPSAIVVAPDGAIHIADNWGSYSRIYRVDSVTGDRYLRVEVTLPSYSSRIQDMQEITDGRFAVAVSVDRYYDRNAVWIADPRVGTFVPSLARFPGSIYSIAVASSGDRVFVLYNDSSMPYRILEIPFAWGTGHPVRFLSSCDDPQPAFSLRPRGLAVDADGSLIVAASFTDYNCTVAGLRSLAGRVYRFDPQTGESTLLYESEPVLGSVSFRTVVVVPEDFPFADEDGDRIPDVVDNCPFAANAGQDDLDGDGIGDACNDAQDPDGDEIADRFDVCPDAPDPLQLDGDGDGVGDACDPFPADSNNAAAALAVDLAEAREDLAMCLARIPGDSDGDGRADPRDLCPGTTSGLEVDGDGCSRAQFCAGVEVGRGIRGVRDCMLADWRNDEPVRPHDCRVYRGRCTSRW